LLIGDMPWMSYHLEPLEALRNAARFVREARCDAVKLEGGTARIPAIKAIVGAGIPVMGHLGLTPQSVLEMGGYKVQGRAEEDGWRLAQDALAIVEAGVFGMVLEGLPGDLARRITAEVDVPTIGIGAGNACDGQVLVYHDLLGMSPGKSPKFVRHYAEIREQQIEAVRRFAGDVRERAFPGDEETYK
jgi:3-methyl-2-oxobutanoate hydroxymethyltransferase